MTATECAHAALGGGAVLSRFMGWGGSPAEEEWGFAQWAVFDPEVVGGQDRAQGLVRGGLLRVAQLRWQWWVAAGSCCQTTRSARRLPGTGARSTPVSSPSVAASVSYGARPAGSTTSRTALAGSSCTSVRPSLSRTARSVK
ncbi:hypothetical protein ABZ543_16530 [Streptomyces roseifaciens]